MKKITAIILAAATAVSLAGCRFVRIAPKNETTAETETGGDATEATNAPSAESTTAPEETSAPAGGESRYVEHGVVKGYTEKGYEIAELDGVTYVNGVLIVNKTYPVPESYNPGGLTQECSDAFNEMAAAAYAEGLSLWVASGFRSYETQDGLYTRYCNSDGKDAADRYSARPGHSEHQTGLAIDVNSVTNAFKDTAEGIWLARHCTEYGFLLRYPEGKEDKTGYIYEPWHVRYLGDSELAKTVTESGLSLEEYFGISSRYE